MLQQELLLVLQLLALQQKLELQLLELELLLELLLELQLLVPVLVFQLACCMLSKRLPTGKLARVIFSCLCFLKIDQKLYRLLRKIITGNYRSNRLIRRLNTENIPSPFETFLTRNYNDFCAKRIVIDSFFSRNLELFSTIRCFF
jgi:hypothetical protein